MTVPGFSRVAILGLLGELESRLQNRGVTMDIQMAAVFTVVPFPCCLG